MRCLIPAFAATLLAAPVLADSMPNLIPAHDVSGTYLVTGRNGPRTVTVEYSKQAHALRLTPQGDAGYILYDFAAHDARMVLPRLQRYLDQPQLASRAQALQTRSSHDDVSIATSGTETIAGHGCTDYTATDHTRGTTSTLCVTADGVLLKLSAADGSAVAQTLSYDAVPPADVQLPPGYTQLVMPQMPMGMIPGGNMGTMGNMNAMPPPGMAQ